MSDAEKKKNGWGGARPGSGPKPKLINVLKLRKLAESGLEAEKSFDLLIQLRDDAERPDELRRDCAVEIMDRIWGKPKAHIEATVGGRMIITRPKC